MGLLHQSRYTEDLGSDGAETHKDADLVFLLGIRKTKCLVPG